MILLMGDVHGEWSKIKHQIKTKNISKCVIIQIGDFGLGFKNKTHENKQLNDLNDFLKSRDIFLHVFRGNHDDPEYFSNFKEIKSNILLLPDFTVINIDNLNILIIGGGVSVDRKIRQENDLINGTKTWFENEVVNYKKINDIKINYDEIDYILSHTAPNNFVQIMTGQYVLNPMFLFNFSLNDETLMKDCSDEQIELEKIVSKCKNLSGLFCGHFHVNHTEYINNIKHRVVDVHEIIELK